MSGKPYVLFNHTKNDHMFIVMMNISMGFMQKRGITQLIFIAAIVVTEMGDGLPVYCHIEKSVKILTNKNRNCDLG